MLDPFAQLFQHCWGCARSLRKVYKDLWVVCFPRCTAGPNIVGSCCIRLHAALVEKTSIEGLTFIFVYVIDYSWNCMTVSFEKTCDVSSSTRHQNELKDRPYYIGLAKPKSEASVNVLINSFQARY